MEKPNHEYYSIDDLIKIWREYEVTQTDLLKWGASDSLQFYIWVSVGDEFSYIEFKSLYYNQIEISEEDRKNGLQNWEEIPFDTIKILSGNKKLYRIAKQTVDHFLKKSDETKVRPKLLPDCSNCPIYSGSNKKCEDSCYVDFTAYYDQFHPSYSRKDPEIKAFELIPRSHHPGIMGQYSDLLNITKNELVVTHDEFKRFETTFLQREEIIPPYLDPANEFYSITLDAAVRTWKALFIDKIDLTSNSAKLAGKKYLFSPVSGCNELFSNSQIKLSTTIASEVAKIAAGEYSADKKKWNNFRRGN